MVQPLPSSHAGPVKSRQVPSLLAPAATEHASQAPASHAELQQTPSTQKLELQSAAATHPAPKLPSALMVPVTTRANGCGPFGIS
jgi:hypothetical protein